VCPATSAEDAQIPKTQGEDCMTQWTCVALVGPLALTFTTGCAQQLEPDDAPLGEADEAFETSNALSPNALSPNALSPNALSPNALSPNALSPNALSPNALSPNALTAIQDPGAVGALSRQLLKYTVSCALRATQSFSFSWGAGNNLVHDETYEGMLGLAPDWATSPLGLDGQQWVSACLAARTNYFSTAVTISLRGSCHALDEDHTPEASTYTKEEGVFWGNLYASPPVLFACHVSENDANSRSQHRDCAAGHVNPRTGAVSSCGMIQLLGTCASYCAPLSTQQLSHSVCWSDPSNRRATTTEQAITVALQ
jgi:hypothetical protein